MTAKRLHQIRNDDKKYIEVHGLSLDRRELLYEVDELHEKLEAARSALNNIRGRCEPGSFAYNVADVALQKLGVE